MVSEVSQLKGRAGGRAGRKVQAANTRLALCTRLALRTPRRSDWRSAPSGAQPRVIGVAGDTGR